MFISIDNIIKIAILIAQTILYIIVFFKLHKLKGGKALTLSDILKKGKEAFTNYIGTINGDKVVDLIKTYVKAKKPTEEDEDKDN